MSEKSRATLKEKFKRGSTPTEEDFEEVLDSSINKIDDQISVLNKGKGITAARYIGIGSDEPTAPLSVRNKSEKPNLVSFEDKSGKEKWRIEIDPVDGENNGLNLVEKDNDSSNLYIQSGGNVGIGTSAPASKLDVRGALKLEKGETIDEISNESDFAKSSSRIVPTQHAVKEYVDSLLVGSISPFAMGTPPDGWLGCNGMALSRTDYSRLFERIGETYGAGDGQTTFNIPDLRGVFVRGIDLGREMDPWDGRTLGSLQEDAFEEHHHRFQGRYGSVYSVGHSHLDHSSGGVGAYTSYWWRIRRSARFRFGMGRTTVNRYSWGSRNSYESHSHGFVPNGDVREPISGKRNEETRPINVALLYCIKY